MSKQTLEISTENQTKTDTFINPELLSKANLTEDEYQKQKLIFENIFSNQAPLNIVLDKEFQSKLSDLEEYAEQDQEVMVFQFGKSLDTATKKPSKIFSSHIQPQEAFEKFLNLRMNASTLLADFLQQKLEDIALEEVFNHFFYQNPIFKAYYKSHYRAIIINLTQEYIKKTFTQKKIKETEPDAMQARKDFITYLYEQDQGKNLVKALVIKKFTEENSQELNKILADELIPAFTIHHNSTDEHFVYNFAEFAIAIDRLSLQTEKFTKKDAQKKQSYKDFIDSLLVRVGAVKTDPYNRRLASLILAGRNEMVKKEFEELKKLKKYEKIEDKEVYKKACKKILKNCLNYPQYIGYKALRIYKNQFAIEKLELE